MIQSLLFSTLLTFSTINLAAVISDPSFGHVISNELGQTPKKLHSVRNKLAKLTEIDISETSIGNISLHDRMQKIINILGQPEQLDTKNIPVCLRGELVMRYKKLGTNILINYEGTVAALEIKNPAYPTSKGVRVGDSVGKFKKAYQDYNYLTFDESSQLGRGAQSFVILINEGALSPEMRFFTRHEKIESISVTTTCD
jgi:hypothetical protein